ncbi:unnamed protein product [Diamesa serratosioi]
MSFIKDHESEKRDLLSDLINLVRDVSSRHSGKLIVTEKHTDIEKLLELWEKILTHGIRSHSILGNVGDLLGIANGHGSQFWSFAEQQLTKHEKERFSQLKNIWTDRGKTKALIRNALNEQCLERYLQIWLNLDLKESYESHALLRDEKSAILPKLAMDLSSILFAISIDVPELNVATGNQNNKSAGSSRAEPIIAVGNAGTVIKSHSEKYRKIESFEETSNILATTMESLKVADPVIEDRKPYEVILPESINNERDKISISTATSSDNLSSGSKLSRNSMLFDDKEDSISRSSISSTESLKQSDFSQNFSPENDLILQRQKERIMDLEAQVVMLTLENSKLKSALSSSKLSHICSFQVSIPRAVLQKTKTKNFYTYEINIKSKNGLEAWTIFKRYREFASLHKKLKKDNIQIKILDFPPKKKLGNLDYDFVEHRRQRLQVYLKHLIQNLPELANCETRVSLEAKFPFFRN